MILKDYYQILEVPAEASLDIIKKSFRQKAVKLHPDKNKSPNAKQDFQELVEAYEILSKQEKRDSYDALRRQYQTNKPVVVTPAESKYEEHQKQAEKNSKKYTDMSWEDFLALDLVSDLGLGLLLFDGDSLFDDVGDIIEDIFDIF